MIGLAKAVVFAAALPWFAPPSTGVVTKNITFTNQGATLKGTLYLPVAQKPVPAVVVYHGASEPLAATPLYRHLREGLPQLGIAVLLFDRRGSGASTGKNNVPYETLADDGIAGANALRGMVQIDSKRVGYWGISQGGWLTTFAAVRDPRAAFAVAVSAPLTTPEAQMEFADANHLYALGYTRADIDDMLEARKMWTGYLRGTNSRQQAEAAIARIQQKPWYQYMYMPTVAQLKGPAESEWRTQMDDDPIAAVRKITIPMLFVLGSSDPWIPVAQTVASLRAVTATRPNIRYVVIPNANHLMMVPPETERMDDATPQAVMSEVPASPEYFMLLGSWLTRTLQPQTPETAAAASTIVSASERLAEDAHWKSLGIRVPVDGIVRADPFSSPYENRSFVVPIAWYASYYGRLRTHEQIQVRASALRQDLPLLQFILQHAYSGYDSAAQKGWNWDRMFSSWEADLNSAGDASLPLDAAFAPWGRLENVQLDNHSGVPGLMEFVSGSRSAVLAEKPDGACSELLFVDGRTRHSLSTADAGQQPHSVLQWNNGLSPAWYLSYPRRWGSASTVVCNGKNIGLAELTPTPDLPSKPRFEDLGHGIGYLRMPTFTDSNDEALRDVVKGAPSLSSERAVILDLRDNDGGNAPLDVLRTFVDGPSLETASQQPDQIGTKSCFRTALFFGLQQQLLGHIELPISEDLREQLQSLVDGLAGEAKPDCAVERVETKGPMSLSRHRFLTSFAGRRLIALVNADCGSDCEYMTYVIANLPGSVIAGSSTYGVMGFTQPGYTVLPHSRIPFRMALSRTDEYGDGRSVDGYGITVDVLLATPDSQSLNSLTTLAETLLQ